LMVPILDQAISQKLIDYLHLQLADNQLAWRLNPDESYTLIEAKKGEEPIDSQAVLEHYINKIYKKNRKTTTSDTLSNKDKKRIK